MFTPLVFSTSSGMGREASEFYKRLADHLSVKPETQRQAILYENGMASLLPQFCPIMLSHFMH